MSKDIYVIRHAKAAPAGAPAGDFERPLRRRGRVAATAIAGYIADHGWHPDLVLCSPARRTRETLAPALDHLATAADTLLEASLYLADAPTLLARLQRVPDAKTAVLLVGHNPGLQELVLLLTEPGRAGARRKIAAKFPTAAIAHLHFPGRSWSTLAPGSATLESFAVAAGGGD